MAQSTENTYSKLAFGGIIGAGVGFGIGTMLGRWQAPLALIGAGTGVWIAHTKAMSGETNIASVSSVKSSTPPATEQTSGFIAGGGCKVVWNSNTNSWDNADDNNSPAWGHYNDNGQCIGDFKPTGGVKRRNISALKKRHWYQIFSADGGTDNISKVQSTMKVEHQY